MAQAHLFYVIHTQANRNKQAPCGRYDPPARHTPAYQAAQCTNLGERVGHQVQPAV